MVEEPAAAREGDGGATVRADYYGGSGMFSSEQWIELSMVLGEC